MFGKIVETAAADFQVLPLWRITVNYKDFRKKLFIMIWRTNGLIESSFIYLAWYDKKQYLSSQQNYISMTSLWTSPYGPLRNAKGRINVLRTLKYDVQRTFQYSVMRTCPYCPICNAMGRPIPTSWGHLLPTLLGPFHTV